MSNDNVVQFGDYTKKVATDTMQYKAYDGTDMDSLWGFSLDTYGKEGVERACLALQSYFGLDVNMILYCLWVGKQGYQLTDNDMLSISQTPHSWQVNTVMPLRATRMQLAEQMVAPHADAVAKLKQTYEDLKRQELDAERMEQELILVSHGRMCADGLMWVNEPAEDYGLHNLTVYANIFATLMVMNDDVDDNGDDHGEVGQVATILEALYELVSRP